MLNIEISDFIRKERICVVAVDSPYAATIHFSHRENPFIFVIQTNSNSLKAEPFSSKDEVRVSLIVGLDEEPNGKDVPFSSME